MGSALLVAVDATCWILKLVAVTAEAARDLSFPALLPLQSGFGINGYEDRRG